MNKATIKPIFNILILIISLPYVGYVIFLAFSAGAFDPLGRGTTIVAYDTNPILFIFFLCTAILVFIVLILLLLLTIYLAIDRKVKQYGGRYNFNTYKAVIRGMLK